MQTIEELKKEYGSIIGKQLGANDKDDWDKVVYIDFDGLWKWIETKISQMQAEVKAQIAETERLLKEALRRQNNDREERGLCCQCREAINNYFNNKSNLSA